MTWSQLEYFLRATTYVQAENMLMAIAVAHNPYVKSSQVERLPRSLRRAMRAAKEGMPGANGSGFVPMTGEALERQMGQLRGMFGPVKRITLSPEDFRKRMEASK